MIGVYDYLGIAFYLVFILSIGFAFRNFNKDSSDYFRGGGSMLWWMCGGSSFMVTISAWSFTGAAGRVFTEGPSVALLYVGNFFGAVFCFLFTAARFRRMRVTTYIQGIRRRFGAANEQFYSWIQMPVYLLYGGIALNAIGIFMSAVFNWPMVPTILALGVVVIIMAVMGGSWSVVASDFVQMLLVLIIVSIVCVMTFQIPEIPGPIALIESAKDHFGMPWETVRMPVLIAWMLALFINQFFALNSMAEGAARYLMVRDGRQARKAAGLLAVLILLAPVLLIIPPLALAISGADLSGNYSQLTRPEEAAYVAISLRLLPEGMMGFLVCAIFAATMSTMDSSLNRNAGIFSLNVYKIWMRPAASEKELLLVGKTFTLFFGILVILIAVGVHYFRTMGLFDLVILVVASVSLPLVIPLFYGLFIRSAPRWAGWTTTLCGFTTAQFIHWAVDIPRLAEVLFGEGLSQQELTDFRYALTVFSVFLLSSSWFFLSSYLNRRQILIPEEIRAFYKDLETPVDPEKEGIQDNAASQYQILSILCLVYGGFILLGFLIPNTLAGRFCFLFAASIMIGIGSLLRLKLRLLKTPLQTGF